MRAGLSRLLADAEEAVVGYQVITIDGARIGLVASLSDEAIVVRAGPRPFERALRLPLELAIVRDVDRSVIALLPPDRLERIKSSRWPGQSARLVGEHLSVRGSRLPPE